MRLRQVRRAASWILLGFCGALLLAMFLGARMRP